MGPARRITTFRSNNHAVRTEQWRYIRYADGGEELYDETTDPYEWTNLAGKPEYSSLKTGLARHFPKVNTPPRGSSSGDSLGGGKGGPARRDAGKKQPQVILRRIQHRRTAVD